MAFWVTEAWRRLHDEHQELIIKTFRNVGLSLNPDGSEDIQLQIKDLPNIQVGDWRIEENSVQTPEVVLGDEAEETVIVDDGLFYTAEEVRAGIIEVDEDEGGVTTDTDTHTSHDGNSDVGSDVDTVNGRLE
jgi:hypothetical protein